MEEEKLLEEEKLPILEHLTELRGRLIYSAVVVLVFFLVTFYYSESIFELLMIPLRFDISFVKAYPFYELVPKASPVESLIFLKPAEAFWMHMKIAMVAAFVVSSPFILVQLWRFISPGLFPKEKRMVLPFIFSVSFLFIFGALFCFFIMLPFALGFLLTYKTGSLTPMLTAEFYVDFCLKFILAFGAVFEIPVVLVVLTRSGLVGYDTLAKNRKYAVLLAFVLAAVLTPTPDAFNMTFMAIPIIFLYEGGLIFSRIFARRKVEDGDD